MDIDTIIEIESLNDPDAFNPETEARGLMQIRLPALKDWNTYHPKEKYTSNDLFDPEINVKIGTWYMEERIPQMLKHYGIEDMPKNRIISYNWGIGNLRKYLVGESELPTETQDYIEKYNQLLEEKKSKSEVRQPTSMQLTEFNPYAMPTKQTLFGDLQQRLNTDTIPFPILPIY